MKKLLALLLITSCIATPPPQDSKIAAPDMWSRMTDGNAVVLDDKAGVEANWWKNFNDPVLNQLIDEAIKNNKNLKIAKARIVEARANKEAETSTLFPQVDGEATAQKVNEGTLYLNQPLKYKFAQVDLDATWELDLFGRNQARVREAKALQQSEEANKQGVTVELLANVARNYFNMRNYERQIKITEDNLANQRQTLELTKAQFEGAILSDFDVERAAAQVSDTEAELPTLKAQYDSSLNLLSVLLGAKPGEKDPLLKTQVELKPLNPQIVIAAPAVIIGNRPDIKVAERQFAASIAASDEAFDNLFPEISLQALYGSEVAPGAAANPYTLAANLTQPIFHFGGIKAGIDAADARQKQAFYNYQETVLEGLEDMENALSSYLNETKRNVSLNNSVAQNRKAAELARLQFTDGDTQLLDVLVADRNVLLAESNLVQSDTLLRNNLVNIYTAAGGGWDAKAKPQVKPDVIIPPVPNNAMPIDFVRSAK